MADYTKWKEKIVSVTSLSLDPRNPRIPPSDVVLSQRDLIAELVEHDNVLELAKDIAEHGYAPLESLIGLLDDEDGKTYILEGNRRLAALKLLLNPESAPESVIKKVRSLAKDVDTEPLKKVRVLHAPSRADAAPLIMQKHTRPQIEQWSPLMKARFYRNLDASGLTPAEIAKQYQTTPGEVTYFLRTDSLYQVARRMELPADAQTLVHNPRKFPVTILQRIIDTLKARELLGIDFDMHGNLVGHVHPDEFKKTLTRILIDIAKGSEKGGIDSRTINKERDVENYLKGLKDDLPNKKRAGSFTAQDFDDKAAQPARSGKVLAKKPDASPRQSKSVIPTGIKCRVKSTRIKDIFDELRRLKLDSNPNASAVLFRILLELCMGHYLDKTGKIAPLLAPVEKGKKPADWYPTLRQMLNAIIKDTSIALPQLARKRLTQIVAAQEANLLDGLDGYVHNRYSLPTAKELRNYWDIFEGLFAVVLQEPPVVS